MIALVFTKLNYAIRWCD